MQNLSGLPRHQDILCFDRRRREGCLALANNNIFNLISTGIGGNVKGISGRTDVATILNISSNTITRLSSTGASATITGIEVLAGATVNVNDNLIDTLSGSGTTSPVVSGIAVSSGTTVNVYKNKIYTLSQNGSLSVTSPAVNGMLFSGRKNSRYECN